MSDYYQSPYLVPFDGGFSLEAAPTLPPEAEDLKKKNKKILKDLVDELDDLQRMLYANDHYSVLLVFQAMDAAGKDGTIRAVTSGVNPAGFQVSSFKVPSAEELDHDFLWRTTKKLPERGRIGIFNRSHYEEVLAVRVHPEFLPPQRIPNMPDLDVLWLERFESIRNYEQHLARNGMVIIKFWLNVSRDEQKERFLDRLQEPDKNWKFSSGDVKERGFWDKYMNAYQEALNATSRPWAPWYAIPADKKHYMRRQVAEIIVSRLKQLGLSYPEVGESEKSKFDEMERLLTSE